MDKCEICKKKPFHPDKKCCFNCTKSNSKCEVWHECGKDCPEWDNAIKTNADRIRAMSDEELAKNLYRFCDLEERAGYCKNLSECEKLLDTEDGIPEQRCICCLLEWLKQPAEKDGI